MSRGMPGTEPGPESGEWQIEGEEAEVGSSDGRRTNYQAIENNIVSGDETPCVGLTRLPPLRWWWSTVCTVLFVIIFVCVRAQLWSPELYEVGSGSINLISSYQES